MDEVVDEQRIVLEHHAALEVVAYLKGGVHAVDGLECVAALLFHNAHAVRKPSYADTVSRNKVFHFD